jgi:hypothetical protein
MLNRSLVLCVCFVDCCVYLCPFSFGHCVVCPSCPMWFPCQMMLISFNFISNKTGFISRSRTAFLTFETDQFLFLTIFYKHPSLNNKPYYYIITFTQCTKIRNYFFDWHDGDTTLIVFHDRLLAKNRNWSVSKVRKAVLDLPMKPVLLLMKLKEINIIWHGNHIGQQPT